MKQVTWGLLLLAVTTLASCQADSGKGVFSNGPTSLAPPNVQALSYRIRWMKDIEIPKHQQASLLTVLDNLVVLIEEPENTITALSMEDGAIRWRHRFVKKSEDLYEPFRRKDVILVNSDSAVYRLSAETGRILEITPLPAIVTGAPTMTRDIAVFGSISDKVYGIDIPSGNIKWEYKMSGEVIAQPVAITDTVLVTDGMGGCALFDIEGGQLLWRQLKSFSRISGQPVASAKNSLFYVPSEDQTLYAFSRATGDPEWTFPAAEPLIVGPTLLNNTLFQPLPRANSLVAIDATTGKELWRVPNHHLTPVAFVGQKLLAFSDSTLLTLDASTGVATAKVNVGEPIAKVTPGPDDSMVICTASGHVIRIDYHR